MCAYSRDHRENCLVLTHTTRGRFNKLVVNRGTRSAPRFNHSCGRESRNICSGVKLLHQWRRQGGQRLLMVVVASVFNVPKSYVMTVMMVDIYLMVVHTEAKFKDSSNALFRPRDHLLFFLSSSMEWDDECSCEVSAFQRKLSADVEEELSNLLLNWLTEVQILKKLEMLK